MNKPMQLIKNCWNLIKNNIFILLSCLIPFLILGFIYIGIGVFPFGRHTILVKDLYTQYVDFYTAFHRIIFNGESPFYSWSKGLGANFWGISSYYLTSPFSLLTLILPLSYLPESITLLTLAKVGCAGLTFAIYLKQAFKARGVEIILFSVPYALMSFMLIYSFNIMWLDGIVFLPLVTLGIERIFQNKSFVVYYLFLTWMLIANYYIAFMLCIFSVLYALYFALLSLNKATAKFYLKRFGVFILSSLLSAGTAAFLLYPAYIALSAGKLSGNYSGISFNQNFSFPDILSKLMFGSYDTALGFLPNIYCGLSILLLVVLFFVNKKVPWIHKILSASFLLIMALSFSTSGINLAWHGLQPPISFLYRYSFIFSFLMLILAFRSYKNLSFLSIQELIIGLVLVLLMVLWIAFRGFQFLSPVMLIISAGLLCLYGLIFAAEKRFYRPFLIILCAAVLIESGTNAWIFINKIDQEFNYVDRVSYSRFSDELAPVIHNIQSNDPDFFRIEKTFSRTFNDPIALGYKGLTHFSSSFDQATQLFLKKIGFLQAAYQVSYTGATIPSDSILGIKYILSRTPDNIYYPEKDHKTGKTGDIFTYENPYALPLAYMVNQGLSKLDQFQDSPLARQNQILQSMTGVDSIQPFLPLRNVDIKLDNVVVQNLDGLSIYKKINPEKDGTIEYLIKVENDHPIYAYLLTRGTSKVQVNLDGVSIGYYGENIENNNILNLGKYTQGDILSLKMRMLTDSYTIQNEDQFYQFDLPQFSQAYQQLSANPFKITEYNDTQVAGNVLVPADKPLLFTSIPYDDGWSVMVDGKKAEKIKLLGAFIGINLPAGQHQLQFFYTLPGLMMGGLITSVSILLFLGFYFGPKIKSRLSRSNNR